MSSELSIKVEQLSKCYQVYERPRDRLKQFILPRLRRTVMASPQVYYRDFWALRDVSFSVKKGETVGIVGRNGSGKSTLLQMICGTLSPTAGSVETSGRIAALLELGSGFNPEFTGRENVYLNAAVLGVPRDEINARFDDILAFAEIGDFIERPVKTYSSGMVVRLAFAVQAMIDPDIFVVDEALAVGDEKFQRKCFARLEELKDKGTSILFVSHSAPSIIEFCDRTLFLERGERLMYGAAAPVVRSYQKLIYAAPSDYELLVASYREADRAGAVPASGREATAAKPGMPEAAPSEYFDPGLVPSTTEAYRPQGAEIQRFIIRNAAGAQVNVLKPGDTYVFEMAGRVHEALPGVYWGLHIRNVAGAEVTGQRYPEEGEFFTNMPPGGHFTIKFSFRVSLLPGVYFIGGGIWSSGEPNCAHRIIDALMIRVAPSGKLKSFGYVDCAAGEPLLTVTE